MFTRDVLVCFSVVFVIVIGLVVVCPAAVDEVLFDLLDRSVLFVGMVVR